MSDKKNSPNVAFIGIFVAIFASMITIFVATRSKDKGKHQTKENAQVEKATVKPTTIETPDSPTGYQIGEQVEDFNLKNVDGQTVALKNYKNAKGYLVIFTCNHCPYAKMYEDRIIALHKTFEAKGYPVVAINPNDPTIQPDDSFEKMQERAKEKNYQFAYLFDETQDVAKKFGATKTPHVFLLDASKKVQYIGAIDDNAQDASQVSKKYVEDAITALEKGESIATNATKAVGCSIKWKK